jgi:glycosyltransferase involved in cell wall biosynthesis
VETQEPPAQALQVLQALEPELTVVASGNPSDSRNPLHPQAVLDQVKALGLQQQFRFLGLIPYDDLMPLMRASVGVLNPSLFEGWSTPVEEAKALGVPMLLSDLPVHREQAAAHGARFFDPHDTAALATLLRHAWHHNRAGTLADSTAAAERYGPQRLVFAQGFADHVAHLARQRR